MEDNKEIPFKGGKLQPPKITVPDPETREKNLAEFIKQIEEAKKDAVK